MTCRTVDVGGGHYAIVCDRGRKPAKCTACKERPHVVLCDYPLEGRKAGETCSVRLCRSCAVHMGEDLDYCPPHARMVAARHDVIARVAAWCEDRFVDLEDVLEFWNERAAIRQYEGRAPRVEAEELAFLEDVVARFGP